jgi:hypothetical protein
MTKRNKIIYWISTAWLALGMLSTGTLQLFKAKAEGAVAPPGVYGITHLGYPIYCLTILGVWKILGVVALLIPEFPLLKEWAYAGFFFAMSGAVFSHIASGDSMTANVPALLLLILTVISWYFRPEDRKIISVKSIQSRTRVRTAEDRNREACQPWRGWRVESHPSLHHCPCKGSVALRRQCSFLDESCFLAKTSGWPTIRESTNPVAFASMFTNRH